MQNCNRKLPFEKETNMELWAKIDVLDALPGYEVSSYGNVRRFNAGTGVLETVKLWNVDTKHGYDKCVVIDTKQGYKTVPVSYLAACSIIDGFKEHFGSDVFAENSKQQEAKKSENTISSTSSERKKFTGVAAPKECVDLNSGTVYKSMKEAQKSTGLSKGVISKMVHGQKDEYKGYRIRFKK